MKNIIWPKKIRNNKSIVKHMQFAESKIIEDEACPDHVYMFAAMSSKL